MNTIAAPRSTFVNVVGWVFLVFSGLGVLVGLLQNLMIHTIFPADIFEQIATQQPEPGMPPYVQWIFGHIKLFFALGLLLSLAHFIAALGLLRRWGWARWLFIGLMAFGIVSSLGGLVLQASMMSGMYEQFSVLHDGGRGQMPDMRAFFIGIGVFSALMSLAFCVLYGWIIKLLLEPAVAAEFRAAQAV
ncbi:MAG: hypothetical protein ABS41_02755 [Arenimonas sp. SCN 70-307]|uniref:hypothetical protein n=1 Tax=Arenimonas sp. SCN 70-307 TaxID=1660089 RepID=UPI00086B464E|nr:hypothetical protein [Arenimonas sp. SCN 70-307]ODS64371.1 MAG: hypothetical protein ABS41_02755 [Arenimonas sp. SCN 70-307]